MSGWNGSEQRGNSAPIRPKATVKKPSPIRGIVAGLVVVALAVVGAYFAFFSGTEKAKVENSEKQHGRIKEVSPAVVTNRAVAEKPKDDRPRTVDGIPLEQCYRDERGVLRYPGGLRVLEKPAARTITLGDGKPSIFRHPSENVIAGLLKMRPGLLVAGTAHYNRPWLLEDFKASLQDPTPVLETDDEQTRRLKNDVYAVKCELAQRMANGENVGVILESARKELQDLGKYREMLRAEVAKARTNPAVSVEDYKDYVKAANALLEKKGLPKLTMPGVLLERALKVQKERALEDLNNQKRENK